MKKTPQEMDEADPLAKSRDLFSLPSGIIYLDGNSLGPLLHGVRQRLLTTIEMEWGRDLIASWNSNHWMEMPVSVGEKIAPLLGAESGQVLCTDNVSTNLFKLLATALKLQPGRRSVLSTTESFPTDLYVIQGMQRLLGRIKCELTLVDTDKLLESIDESTNLLVLSHVNFRTGALHDIDQIVKKVHEHGAMLLVDVSHSVGVVPLEFDNLKVDFAVGCGYKFLNGGPGAPAFIYINKRHQNKVEQPLSGWMGHSSPFEFGLDYLPAKGIARYQSGTPGILGMAAMDAAMAIWPEIEISQVREKSIGLTSLFIELVAESAALSSMDVVSPLEAEQRSSQVSLAHDQAYAIVQALIEKGVVCDYREPNLVRMGFAPLYIGYQDVSNSVSTLSDIVGQQTYLADRFKVRQAVT